MLNKLTSYFFPLQITKKIYVWMIILVTIPTVILSVTTYLEFVNFEKNIAKHELYVAGTDFTEMLEESNNTFPNILEKNSTLNQTKQINLINSNLQPLLDKFVKAHPNLGVEIYSYSLDSVVSYGPNFTPDQLTKAFFTTKEYGTGLGLAVCYSIAARHSATINFISNSTGTTFNVFFNESIPHPEST